MAARILKNSPRMVIKEEDLGKMPTRTKINTLDHRRRDAELSTDDNEYIQGYGLCANVTGVDYRDTEYRHGPCSAPDPRAARERRARRLLKHRARCTTCGKFGHEAARCEFLAMYLYCKKYMQGKSEVEI
jgi:hypothetical protein